MSRFDELLTDLEEIAAADALAKASVTEEEDLMAKSDHAEPDEDDEGGESDDDEDNDEDGDDDDGKMAKSFSLTLPDGTQAEAFDGTLLIKSLRDETEAGFDGLAKAIRAQTALIKSLQSDNHALRAQVDVLAKSGRGRKSAVLTVHEKLDVGAIPQNEKPTPRDLMAKALEAQKAGRLSGVDVAILDNCLGSGKPAPESLLAKIGG